MKRFALQIITAAILLTSVIAPLSAAAQTTSAANPTGQAIGGVASDVAGVVVGPVIKAIDTIIELAVLPIAGFIFWITGQMLDFAIEYSLNISQAIGNASSAIILGWTIIRDVFNMMFIFSIIWIAIETMLDIGKWHGKQILIKIIVAAVLINFSFFFTEVIIDAGNIFGGWFYNGIITTLGTASNAFHSGATLTASGVSLSAGISTALGVYDLYSPTNSIWGIFSLSDTTQSLIGAVVRLGIIAFSSYIFAYVAVLFIARTVSLLFSLVTSPIGFAGGVLPQTEDYAKKWWKELRDNVLLAPIFLLLLYIIIAFVNTPIFKGVNIGTTTTAGGFSITQYFKYFLLAFMLRYALTSAKEHSGQLGDAIGKMAGQIGQFAVGAATGGAGLVGQLTIGAAAARIAGSRGINEVVAGGGVKGAVAGFAQKRISGVADYHFNPAGSVLGKETGFKTGKGYTGLMKDLEKQQKEATEKIIPKAFELKEIKDDLKKAEREAYGQHDEFGNLYKTKDKNVDDINDTIKDKSKKGEDVTDDFKALNAAKKERDRVKAAIDADPAFKLNEKIFEEQKKILATMTDPKKITAMKTAMAPERAAQTAEGKVGFAPGINIAQMLSGKEVKINIPFTEKKVNISEGTSKIVSRTAQVLTAGISKAAAEQYAKDVNKGVKAIRDAGEKDRKKGEKDISKIIAEAAAEEAGSGGPAAAPSSSGPSTPPPTP
jgi:hypothetical protein